MYVLDGERIRETVKARGYRSLGELARSLGVHRNMIHYYLAGRPVFPATVEKMFRALGLKPDQALKEKRGEEPLPHQKIAPLVDRLHSEFPEATFVLFGSRARGAGHRYSDWDIGVFSRKGVDHSLYLRLLNRSEEIAEPLPFFIQIVNLNRADKAFLAQISREWVFLAGQQQDWIELQKRALA